MSAAWAVGMAERVFQPRTRARVPSPGDHQTASPARWDHSLQRSACTDAPWPRLLLRVFRVAAPRCSLERCSAADIERRPRGASRALLARACFGPMRSGGFARDRLGARQDIATYTQGGRAHLSLRLLARNKRGSERSSRCAARAALDIRSTTPLKRTPQEAPTKPKPSLQSPSGITPTLCIYMLQTSSSSSSAQAH